MLPQYDSFEDYYNDIIRQTLDSCAVCGECVRNCTTFPLSPLADEAPDYIVQKMIDFLSDGMFSVVRDAENLRCFQTGLMLS